MYVSKEEHELWQMQSIGKMCGCGQCTCCRSLTQPRARSVYQMDLAQRFAEFSKAARSWETYIVGRLNNI